MTKIKDITEKQFKSALCRLSIAIPFTFIFAAAYCRTSLYYPESKTSVLSADKHICGIPSSMGKYSPHEIRLPGKQV